MTKMKVLLFIAAIAFSSSAHAQSLSGIRVGANISTTSVLGSSPVAQNRMGPFVTQKWISPDRNELSITSIADSGRIVYIESNWGGGQGGTYTDFPGIFFNRTRLADIRAQLRSNGFGYRRNTTSRLPDGSIVMFNSFEIERAGSTVVTFATKIDQRNIGRVRSDPSRISEYAQLDAIILADSEYLANIWGDRMAPDPAYRKIVWPSRN